jgi:DNA-binding beta-propeller fold protein YncE
MSRSLLTSWYRLPWQWIIALSLPLAIGCDSSQPVAPLNPGLASESRETGQRAMSQAALFVGNFSFFDFFPAPASTNGILRYTSSGAFIDNLVPEGTAGLTIACCMTFGPDENLYVGSPLTGNVLRYNGVTGAFIDEFVPSGSGGLVAPLILVFHDSKLFVGDASANQILRYDAATGAFIDVFVPAGSGGMGQEFGVPQGFGFGTDGNLYVSNPPTSTTVGNVLRFNGRTGAFIDVFIRDDAVSNPGGLTFGPHGDLYVTSDNGVNRYNGKTGALIDTFVDQGSGGLDSPVGIAFGPDGNFYVASTNTGQILRYDRKGRFIDAFVQAGRGDISGPRTIEWKVSTVVCHSKGSHDKGKSITIGYLSAAEHLAHGDVLGPCADGREEIGDGG